MNTEFIWTQISSNIICTNYRRCSIHINKNVA